MPAHLFQLQEIVGRYLIKLMLASDGSHFIEKRHDGKLVFSKAPVSGCVSPKQEIRTYGPMLGVLHLDGALEVCFGREKLREACEDKPCADLNDVSTPRSDTDTDPRFRDTDTDTDLGDVERRGVKRPSPPAAAALPVGDAPPAAVAEAVPVPVAEAAVPVRKVARKDCPVCSQPHANLSRHIRLKHPEVADQHIKAVGKPG